MPAVIKEREELWVEPAQRTNAENYVEQDKRARAKRPHEHDFVCYIGKPDFGQQCETDEEQSNTCRKDQIVNALLTVPLNCTVFDAHSSTEDSE
jgi:hypothetical protein